MAFSSVSGVTNHFAEAHEGFMTTLNASITAGADTVEVGSVAGLTDGEVVVWIIEPGTAKEQVFTGTVNTTMIQIEDVIWTRGTDVAHTAGVTIVDYVTGTSNNMLVKGMLVSHEQDGTFNENGLEQIFELIYPIGSLYTNATAGTNPGTLLGFGTWEAYGEGRVVVGKAASGTFNTLGATGGAETHTLTNDQMPTHSFNMSHHGDEAGSLIRTFSGVGGTLTGGSWIGAYRPQTGPVGGPGSYYNPTISWGSDQAHNILQPYIVAYIWKRTA